MINESIPIEKIIGNEITEISIYSHSIKFKFSHDMSIVLLYYGFIEDSSNWIYNLRAFGPVSIQGLMGLKLENLYISYNEIAICIENNEKIIVNMDKNFENNVEFTIDGLKYFW